MLMTHSSPLDLGVAITILEKVHTWCLGKIWKPLTQPTTHPLPPIKLDETIPMSQLA